MERLSSRSREPSVSNVVREIVRLRPFLLDALRAKIVNYSALARALRGEVEERLGRKVSIAAIKMALIRLAESEERRMCSVEERIGHVIAGSTLTLIDDIAVLTLKGRGFIKYTPLLARWAERARFFQLTHGLDQVSLVVDLETLEKILSDIPRENIEELIGDQSAVVMISPPDIITTPGVVSYVTSIVAMRGINVTQFISAHKDTIFVVSKRDSLEVYRLLKELIERFRERLKKPQS